MYIYIYIYIYTCVDPRAPCPREGLEGSRVPGAPTSHGVPASRDAGVQPAPAIRLKGTRQEGANTEVYWLIANSSH